MMISLCLSLSVQATEKQEMIQELIKHNSELTKTINSNNQLISKALDGNYTATVAPSSMVESNLKDIKVEKKEKRFIVDLSFVSAGEILETQKSYLYSDQDSDFVTVDAGLRLSAATKVIGDVWLDLSYSRGTYTIESDIDFSQRTHLGTYNNYSAKVMYDLYAEKYNIHFMPYLGLNYVTGLVQYDQYSFDDDIESIGGISSVTAGVSVYTAFSNGILARLGLGIDSYSAGFGYTF
jgi:hypothetical protein